MHGSRERLVAVLERSVAEPWYPDALAILEKITAGDLSLEGYRASRRFFYGRWDEAARGHAGVGIAERHAAARQGYFADVAIDVLAIRAALIKLGAPVLLYGRERDPVVTAAMLEEAAPLFYDATIVVQPGAGHFPWGDDPGAFALAVGSFLA